MEDKNKIIQKYKNVVRLRNNIKNECYYKTGTERENCDYIIELFDAECKKMQHIIDNNKVK